MDTDIKIHMAPPLGLLTIKTLFDKEHCLSLENENIEEINYDDNPDVVGISVTVDTFPRAVRIAKKFRDRGIKVVAGGIHITTAYDTVPPDCFDALCIGAAELTWPRIVEDIENGGLKYIYRCDEGLTSNDVVSPAYESLDGKKYLYCNIVHTSRGCPFTCDFCYNSSSERDYVNRNMDDVIEDIKTLNTRHIMFIDDNFAGNVKWTKEFLEKIKPMKLKWQAAVSINAAFDAELLDLMKESGCQSLFIGFESINSESIGDVHKVQNCTDKYELAITAIHDRGIMINGSFVFGLDADTVETFKTTLDWIVKNKIETVTSHILTPYPGTVLYEKLRQEGRILSDNLELYNTANVVFKPKGMTEEELYNGYIWIYKQIYSFKNIIKRLPRAKKQRAPYLLFNFLYRKYGKFTDFLCKLISYKRIGWIAEKLSRYL